MLQVSTMMAKLCATETKLTQAGAISPSPFMNAKIHKSFKTKGVES